MREGIFGVGRLATQLKALEGADQIGSWHVGHWIDHTHTAIRIRFDNDEDAEVRISHFISLRRISCSRQEVSNEDFSNTN